MTGTALNDSKDGIHRSPAPRPEWGRFSVLRRMDGRLIVYDPEKPCGNRTISDHPTEELAAAAAMIASAGADARGEPNERPRTGYKYDWNDPKVWERFADPSLSAPFLKAPRRSESKTAPALPSPSESLGSATLGASAGESSSPKARRAKSTPRSA
jgi:hypothetical protein